MQNTLRKSQLTSRVARTTHILPQSSQELPLSLIQRHSPGRAAGPEQTVQPQTTFLPKRTTPPPAARLPPCLEPGAGTHQSVLMVQMKNWEPLVLGPAFAMDRTPEKQAGVSHAAPGGISLGCRSKERMAQTTPRTLESEEDQALRTSSSGPTSRGRRGLGSSPLGPGQDPPTLGFSHCTVGLKADTMLRSG